MYVLIVLFLYYLIFVQATLRSVGSLDSAPNNSRQSSLGRSPCLSGLGT